MSSMQPSKPFISIIVPTYNAGATINECIQSLMELDYPKNKYEVIIVDGGSTDETPEIVRRCPVKLTVNKFANTPGAARNIGAKNAVGEFLAFTDSDCYVDKNWLLKLLEHMTNSQIGSVGGPNITPSDDPFLARSIGHLFISFFGSAGARNPLVSKEVIQIDHNPPCNVLIRKDVFFEVGLFNEEMKVNEDIEFDLRLRSAGYKQIYTPHAKVWHRRRSTLHGFMRQMLQYGRWYAISSKSFPQLFKIAYLFPPIGILSFIALLSLYLLGYLPVYFVLLPLVAYFLFGIWSMIITSIKTKDVRHSLLIPFLGLIEHISLAVGFIYGLLFGKKIKTKKN